MNASASIVACKFNSNIAGDERTNPESSARGLGGAVASYPFGLGLGPGSSETGTFFILNCQFLSNQALYGGYGGALYTANGAFVTMVNSLIAANDAWEGASSNDGAGGGAYLSDQGDNNLFVNCTFADNYVDGDTGGVFCDDSGCLTMVNSIVWNNDDADAGAPDNLTTGQTVTYPCLEEAYGGTGNTTADPQFEDGWYRLTKDTPFTVRDAGDDDEIDDFLDEFDLDGDGVVAEIVLDLDLDVKRIIACHVDMGAYEYFVGLNGQCTDADLNSDCVVNVLDLLQMLGAWGPNEGHPADLNDDDEVNVLDLLFMLSEWGACTCASECVESLQTEVENSDLTWSDWEEFMALFMVEEPDEEEVALYVWWLHHYLSCHNNQTCPGVMGAPDDDPYGGH